MGAQLRAELAALCLRYGWCYGVVWCVDPRDPRLLEVEESYWEEQVGGTVQSMLHRVHMVGEGAVGESIISGKDKWIYHDAYGKGLCSTGSADDPKATQMQAVDDLMHQFLAGIQTIMITSLPSSGVMQFGSTKKIPESLEFIDQAKYLFQRIGSMSESSSYFDRLKETKIDDQHEAFACTISMSDVYCGYGNTQSFHEKNREKEVDTSSLEGPSQSISLILPRGSSRGSSRSQHNTSPHALSLASSFSGPSIYFSNPLQRSTSSTRNSVLHLEKQDGGVGDALFSHNTKSLSTSDSHKNRVVAHVDQNSWAKVSDLPIMDQELLAGIGGLEMSNLFHKNSCNLPCESALQRSSQSSRQYGVQDPMPEARPSAASDSCLSVSKKLPSLSQEPCNANPTSDVPSFAPELLETSVPNLQDSTPEYTSLLHTKDDYLIHLTDQQPVQMNEKGLAVSSVSSNFGGNDASGCIITTKTFRKQVENFPRVVNSPVLGSDTKEDSSTEPAKLLLDYELLDGMEFDLSANTFAQQYWDDIIMPAAGSGNCSNLSVNVLEHLPEMQMASTSGATKGSNSEAGLEQLLHAIVGQTIMEGSSHGFNAKNTHPNSGPGVENPYYTVTSVGGPSVYRNQIPSVCLPAFSQTSNVLFPYCISDIIHTKEATPKSNASSWIDDCCSMNNEGSVLTQPKKPEEGAKIKKRARPGESARPRPKDRQQIQDRVKELREIVPNGAKCSIDSLLDRTIKHMLFLQSVTKYADKLKQADEPKMIVEESGVVLKDNSGCGSSGGATWAYEVAGQTMVCPIMVEDLTPPGQMLVEMLCEERGIFLEIADIIRGFGLTILKGVMEIREQKIWARFLVEANRDVTRLEIFVSLVQLLQHNSRIGSNEQATEVLQKADPMLNYQQSPISI